MNGDNLPYTWVWLDLDDTLIDFQANSRAALLRLYADCHLAGWFRDAEAWLDSYHAVNRTLWELYNNGEIDQDSLRVRRFSEPLMGAGMEREETERLSRALDPLYLDYLAGERRLMPGAAEMLRSLRELGYRIGILSNGFNGVQQRKIASAGIDGYVDLVVLSDEIGVNKPHRPIFDYAMMRSGEHCPGRHIMIGDNPATDIAGAIAAGWHAILYSPSGTGGDSPLSFEVVTSLHDIPAMLLHGR